VAPEENLAEVGGFATLKAWLAKRQRAFEPAAEKFGTSRPRHSAARRPGRRQTLVAKAVAREWRLPLLKMEPGRLYDKYIGESDKNLERALHMAEAMAPCVLMIDEIEKGLSYSQSSESDAGLSRRIFGRLLGWLQDRRAPVFVIATSNAISQLPPELTPGSVRRDLLHRPATRDERKQIFTIHLKKRGRNPAGSTSTSWPPSPRASPAPRSSRSSWPGSTRRSRRRRRLHRDPGRGAAGDQAAVRHAPGGDRIAASVGPRARSPD